MKPTSRSTLRVGLVITLMFIITIASSRLRADTGTCGGGSISLPFTDVPSSNVFFCSIAEAFFSGLSNGTTPTTYSPAADVNREQMAAFVSRTMDQSLKRGSRRAALEQWASPTATTAIETIQVGTFPQLVESDGADLWVANFGNGAVGTGSISRVRASDGKVLGSPWTGASRTTGILVAKGLIFATGNTNTGSLYQIDPTQPAGTVTTLTNSLGVHAFGIAFDGYRIWTANQGSPGPGSVSIVTFNPFSVLSVSTGFSSPAGILFDGANIWVADTGDGTLKKLDSTGNILQSVIVGTVPGLPVFDGTNIWVPNATSSSVTVVRAATGAVLATLTGNGLDHPFGAAFDGERILVTNQVGNSVSLWKASDLTPLGFVPTESGSQPVGACSDGINFWITLLQKNQLARF